VDEKELLARCLEGDEAAWRGFVARYDAALSHLARHALRAIRRSTNPAEVDEVRSGVLELLVAHQYRVLRSFRWQCSFESWLRVLVRTVCIRMIRRKSVDPADLASPATADVRPYDRLLAEETSAAVRRTLEELPARDRIVLTMFFIDGRSYQEIAAEAKIPMGTIATVISRSREKLKELLKARGLGY
jgi:RNA polymerase sigma-70 factor (ECF subfamily)